MRLAPRTWLALVTLTLGALPAARAAQVTDVLDAFDGERIWDGALAIRYERIERRSKILREWACQSDNALGGTTTASPLCPGGNAVLDTEQLNFSESLNILDIDLRLGLWHDLEFFATVPVIMGWSSELTFADGVSGANSLVSPVVDDSTSGGTQILSLFGVPNSSASRVGIGDLVLGFRWQPVNEERDPSMPSWMIGLSYIAPTGEARTAGGTGVGSAVHALRIETAISRRFGIVDPYLKLGGTLRFPTSDGPFKHERTTQTLVSPGHTIDFELGTELYAWRLPSETESYLSIDVALTAGLTFEGREFTELFDALGSSGCGPDNNCNETRYARGEKVNGLDRRTDGVTDVEQYADLGARIGVTYRPMEHFKVKFDFDYAHTTDHFITFADAGRDLDLDGRVERRNAANQGVNEYNPFYNDHYDSFGKRFRVSDKHTYTIMLMLEGQL